MSCFSLITKYIEISNNKYSFNNYDNNYSTTISFGLYDNSNNNYEIRGVPSNYPLTFFSQTKTDISNILKFEVINKEPIIIYVSRGQDVSYNNGDYFRFYDTSYQLLNINHGYRTSYDSSLTDVKNNFYFMNNRSYKFITTRDFSNAFPFTISGSFLTGNNTLNSNIDASFTIIIPNNADNSSNRLYYKDNDNDISGNLYILKDVSGLKYYYGDISFSYIYNADTSNIKLSIKSYDFSYGSSATNFGNREISNNDMFFYSSTCEYIVRNFLPNNHEFLNKVSAIDISYTNNTNFKFSFNKNKHSIYTNNTNNTQSIIYDLSFGLGIGSYIIIDVSQGFPMRLVNSDISNAIAIDTTYQSDRVRTFRYNNFDYYSGSFKVNVFKDFSRVNIEILNNTTATIAPIANSSKFFFTNMPHISGGTYGQIGTSYLNLINQQDNEYSYNESSLPSNIYKLYLDESYIEKSYVAIDKYGNNLNIAGFIKTIPPSIQSINQDISNNINNGIYDYNILYSVKDYENNTLQNIRTININSGPIIEISSNYFQNNFIYKNNNRFNNILQFQNNTFDSSYNFFNNINVYIFDISRRRINIPFEISISGEYYDNSKNKLSKNQLINSNPYPYSYIDTTLTTASNPKLTFGSYYYYAYYNNFVRFRATGTDVILIQNYVASSINIDNSLSVILTLSNNKNLVDICNNANTIIIKAFSTSASGILIKNIDNPFDSSYIILYYDTIYQNRSNITIDLSGSLKLNNNSFELNLRSRSPATDSVKIDGRFNNINFFGKNDRTLIDTSFVGYYNLQITTKSLSPGDNFYVKYNTKFFNRNITDISKNYSIIIQDISNPYLTFYNKQNTSYDISYVHYYPRRKKFHILNDICFINLKNIININSYINSLISNKPLIQYRDDSIYDVSHNADISFTITTFNTNISNNILELSLNNVTLDSSCIITYKVKDICNNYSQNIHLLLNFVNVPIAELSGNAIYSKNFIRNGTYTDEGINIFDSSNIGRPFIPREISFNIVDDVSSINIDNISYDISYNTDISLNVVGDYSFNYIITISNSDIRFPLKLTRIINIIDNYKPSFLFPDFSSINYTITNETSYNSFPLIDTSAIDFSFVVYRTFEDLSKALYAFDISDNYLLVNEMRSRICFSNNIAPFSFNDISNYFDSSQNKVLNKVTKSIRNPLPRLEFTYKIEGSYNLSEKIRRVHIIDNNGPTIDFSFNNCYSNGYKYVYFDNSFKDFSYIALDYNKSYGLGEPSYNFIQELSSILFNFDLSDNFDSKSIINYSITISNATHIHSINNVNDLSNNIDIKNLFYKKDSSFTIIYDISDNQYNHFTKQRKVLIIDISTNIDISFLSNPYILTVSFGDTNYNVLSDVSFTHKRLTATSISFDISYIFPNNTNTLTSISGNRLFDPSALIYKLGAHEINYFPKAYSSSFYTKVRTIDISNRGPIINFPIGGADISHEIYTTLTDASLIFGVISNSIYDAFFFNNYKGDLSYNGTNFKITYDSSLNILEPSSGLYNIYYSSTDLCGINTIRRRNLDVADRRPPVITICGDSIYGLSGENSYYIPAKTVFKDYGATAYDVGTRTQIYDISIIFTQEKRINTISNIILNTLTYETSYVTISNNLLTSRLLLYNPIRIADPDYRVIYRTVDSFNNTQDICRNIYVITSLKPILYPYIEISNNNGTIRHSLLRDISINTQLRNTLDSSAPMYDLSLSLKYNINTLDIQNIVCEAIQRAVFKKNRTSDYVKFVLEATTYNDISLQAQFINVAYETVDSLNLNSSQKIYFYARDLSQTAIDQISLLEYNLNFVDNTPPRVTLLNNRNFNNIYDLSYPLLSRRTFDDLSININMCDTFNNLYNKYEKFYKQSLYVQLFEPGININDIVNGKVDYIDSSFHKLYDDYNFNDSDISINYYKIDGSLIDVSTILFDGCNNNFVRRYKQRYSVRDKKNNYNNDVSRNISVERFPPFINLNYQADCSNNKYITYYHKQFEKYKELSGAVIDYFDGTTISFENVIITNTIDENSIGAYTINYDVSNTANIYNNSVRKVNVINTLPLQQQETYNLNTILNFTYPYIIDKSYNKYSLYNGTYKFDVSHNRAINIKTQEYDICNGVYDISNIVSITSDSSYSTINKKKFYYNNVSLTVSGDFNKLSLELSNNTIYPNIFVYDNQNTFINMHDVLRYNENNVVIDNSFIVNINGLNDPLSKPYFTFENTTARDLHLSIGNYRFYQYGYNNFHNPIKFSIIKDGIHNGGSEYTKNIFRTNLPGVSILNMNSRYNSNYVQINIDATTPSTLYYYCENFPGMGGKIQIKNNIIFSKEAISLNNFVIDSDNVSKIFSPSYINTITDEVLKNRIILTQRFNITGGGGDSSFVNITCITQRNIQHNILYNTKQHPYKLIIRKHKNLQDMSFTVTDYSVMKNNTHNFLVANRGSDYSFSNTYINLIKYEFDTSLNNARKESDPRLNVYDEDIRTLFYNFKNYNYFTNNINQSLIFNEILNYSDFFRKNHLAKTLLQKSFKYKINDFFYINPSKILNLGINNEYNYIDKLLAPRIKITNIIANYVHFTLEIYYNTNNNWYLLNADLSTNREVLFGTYDMIVYSDRFINNLTEYTRTTRRDFITFYNGSITITNNLIYSYNAELSNNYYDYRIFTNMGNNDLSNTVFLNIKDTSNINSVCGLTKKNLYNNVYFDENQILIFHKFNEESIVNYQVNTPTLTLQDTLNEETNNDNYLIDINKNNNDVYKFYNERPLTYKTLIELGPTEEYNIYIAFAIRDELSNNNMYLSQFDICSIYLNNIPFSRAGYIYRQYSQYSLNSYNTDINIINEISYNSIRNRLCSHSYIIDLNDYFDINIYKDTLLENNLYTTDFLNVNRLKYKLLDLSYVREFNLYDISASQNVIFNAANLNLLLSMRNKIMPLYFKLTYMTNILIVSFPNTIISSININFKDDDNINYYINLLKLDPSNLIVDVYTNDVSIYMLNKIYQEIFDNIRLLIIKFDAIISSYNNRHNYLVNITNFLNMVINFNELNINYLNNTLTLLDSNVNNILDNMLLYREQYIVTELLKIYNLTTNITLNNNILNYTDISYLGYCFQNFYILNNDLDLLRKEVAVRNYNYGISFESYKNDMASNTTNFSQRRYRNLYTINNLDAAKLYEDLKVNYILLNANFILDYYNVLYNYVNVTNYSSPIQQGVTNVVTYPAYNANSIISYETLYTNVKNLYNIITDVFNIISDRFDIINKPTIYVNKTYEFFGTKLLINSYYSNSISIKLNIQYNKSLYQIIDLSTIYLDITIPDLTPPTIIFNDNNDICFNENVFNYDASVNNLINSTLISGLSYVDLNQSYSITYANALYYDNSTNNRSLIRQNNNSLLEIDFTDVSNINFGGALSKIVTIKYNIFDNANNMNSIRRKVLILNAITKPLFFYNKKAYDSSTPSTDISSIVMSETITENEFITTLRNAITILNPRIHELRIDLYSLQVPPKDLSFIDISYIQILNIEQVIFTCNLSNINSPVISYQDATIKSFYGFINTINNNLYIKYFSSTQIYNIEGTFTIKLQITRSEVISATIIDTHCCYPKIEYKPIQDNYKLGSQNSITMRMAKYLINRTN